VACPVYPAEAEEEGGGLARRSGLPPDRIGTTAEAGQASLPVGQVSFYRKG